MTDTDRLAALLHEDFMDVLPIHQRYPAPCSVCEGRAARLIAAGVTLAPEPPDALDVERLARALERVWTASGVDPAWWVSADAIAREYAALREAER